MASASAAGPVSVKDAEWLRIYCSTHNLGFTTPRGPRIKCESGGHELDHGFPQAQLWEYCCDCQNYWLVDSNKVVAEQECPACERRITKRYFCDECQIIATESNSPARRKTYSISSTGKITPACPGCLASPPANVNEHDCTEFGGSFLTPRSICSFCDKALEPPPSFPSSVSSYLETVRQPLVKLEFDPESNVLRESQSGSYLLIEKSLGLTQPIVIPSADKISSKQDYYNTYYELFNCDNPAPGEVIVRSPAVVEKVEDGWQLREPGFIDIKPDQMVQLVVASSQVTIPCPACGKPAAPGHAYCKHCGAPVLGQQSPVELPERSGDAEPQFAKFSDPQADQVTETLSPSSEGFWSSASPVGGIPWKAVVAGVVGIFVVGIVIAIGALSGSGILPGSEPSVEKKLDRAIAAGNLFSPSNENAHDLFYQLKNNGATEATLGSYRDRLLPMLTGGPLQMISNLMTPGSEDPPLSEWQTAIQPLRWAAELKSGDAVLRSRAIYCEGRIAYLLKKEDEALAAWSRAADVDKTWPLPANGMGLIYFSRKKYGIARTHYLEAVRRDPSWAYPYNNLGTAYHYDKNDSVAKDHYRKAIELAPHWARPHAWLGEIAMKEGDFATAVAEYEAVLDQNATGTTNMDLDKIRSKLEEARQQMSITGY